MLYERNYMTPKLTCKLKMLKVARSHNNLRSPHRISNIFVWQHLPSINVRLVFNDYIFAQHCGALHSHPLPHAAFPSDYTTFQPSI